MRMTLYFRCELLSDLIVTYASATRGNPKTLDYIPGINFMGVAAFNYARWDDEAGVDGETLAYTVFHSGKVRFYDAHPVSDGMRTLTIPQAWGFGENSGEICIDSPVYRGHRLKKRKGFFSPEGRIVVVNGNFGMKAAYQGDKRRSKKDSMFLYRALTRGSQFLFPVDFHIPDDAARKEIMETVRESLAGQRSIGRFRSAQYGQVRITCLEDYEEVFRHGEEIPGERYVSVYAETPLCFFNRYGEPVLTPDYSELIAGPGSTAWGEVIPEAVCWERSRVQALIYAPWNGARKRRDNDRVCMDKGSVIILDSSKIPGFKFDDFKQLCDAGLGFYKNEGMGRVLVNPFFLEGDENRRPRFHKSAHGEYCTDREHDPPFYIVKNGEDEEPVLKWIRKKEKEGATHKLILEKVMAFCEPPALKVKGLDKISASQWNRVRNTAAGSEDLEKLIRNLFNKNNGILCNGVSASFWKNRQKLKDAIEEMKEHDPVKFTVLLAAEAARRASGKER